MPAGRFHPVKLGIRPWLGTMSAMNHPVRFTLLLALLLAATPRSATANWPTWRGPNGDGVSPVADLPTTWSATKNIRWRVDLPDRGNSTPIVWGDRIFVTQAVESEHLRSTMALDRMTGRTIWRRGTTHDKPETTHEDNPYCAASPVTDGNVVVSTYGSAGVFAYDLDGKELWRRDLGPQVHVWGNASSPVIHDERVFLYHGPGAHSALYALDLKSGATIWKRDLPEPVPTERFDGFAGRGPGIIGSFSTPVLANFEGRDQLVISLPEQLRSFATADGADLWHCRGLNPLVYTSPVIQGDHVLTLGGVFGAGMLVKPKGTGDITESARVWHEQRARKNRLGTGVIKDGLYFHLNQDGIAECFELATGRQVWLERLPNMAPKGDSWSSALLAGDHVYMVNQSGETHVVKAGREFEVVASNAVGEPTNSSLVVAGKDLILRTHRGLWCISQGRQLSAH